MKTALSILIFCLGLSFRAIAQVPQPTLIMPGGSSVLPYYGGTGLQLTVSPGSSLPIESVAWYMKVNGVNVFTGIYTDGPDVIVFVPGTYLAYVSYYSDDEYTVPTPVVTITEPVPSGQNCVVATTMLHNNIRSEDDLKKPYPSMHGITSVSYADELGRTVQTIQCQASPGKMDIVQPVTYDPVTGMPKTSYLPYTGSKSGAYHPNAITEQETFYNTTGQKRAVSAQANATAVYDNSPLGIMTEQGGPGAAYQLSTGKTDKFTYRTNTANEVVNWVYNPATTQASGTTYVPAGTLQVKEVTNTENQVALDYTDPNGKVLLRKFKPGPTATTDVKTTYYVYDEQGRLVYEVPFLATVSLGSAISSWIFTSSHAACKGAMHYYQYDNLDRAWYHRPPGREPDYIIYDRMNRPVLTQNGVQRLANQWSFVKYDKLGRTIYSGLYGESNPVQRTPAGMQNAVNSKLVLWEERQAGTAHGYSVTNAFPNGGDSVKILNISYYDDYNFDYDNTNSTGIPDVGHAGSSLKVDYNVSGRQTATKSKVMTGNGSEKWIWTVVFYDEMGRVLQKRSNSHVPDYIPPVVLNNILTNNITFTFDFSGKVMSSYEINMTHGCTTQVNKYYTYDHMGRLLTEVQQNNNGPVVSVKELKYNELGQVIEKNLHKKIPQTTFLQSIDYTYNLQGRLTHINNPELAPGFGSNNDDNNDLFGMQLSYEDADQAWSVPQRSVPRFDGKISAVRWRTNDAVNSNSSKDQMFYSYNYSKYNEYNNAYYSVKTTGSWVGQNKNQEYIFYDAGGNTDMIRRFNQNGMFYEELAMYRDYNKITTINQNMNLTIGLTQTVAYTYNANGNLITDSGKKLTIEYNHMDLVSRVTWKNASNQPAGEVQYIYSAEGTMVQKIAFSNASGVTTKTDYIDGFCFRSDGVLDFFVFSEGRVVNKGTAASPVLDYEYRLTDHQGYTRINFTDNNGVAKVVQENHFYPSGLRWGGGTWPSGADKFMLQGKELQEENFGGLPQTATNWYDFGARMYDPAVMRWWAQDAVYQHDSPYIYCGNDPINRFDRDGNCDSPIGDCDDELPAFEGTTEEVVVTAKKTEEKRVDPAMLALKFAQGQGSYDLGDFREDQYEFGFSMWGIMRVVSDAEINRMTLGKIPLGELNVDAGPPNGGTQSMTPISPLTIDPAYTQPTPQPGPAPGNVDYFFDLGDATLTTIPLAKLGAFMLLPLRPFAANMLRPLGLGSTGRTIANNLVEQMAMKNAMANPQMGQIIMTGLKDSRWLGWSKMQYSVKTQNGVNAVVHYVGKWENGVLKAVDDFKFK